MDLGEMDSAIRMFMRSLEFADDTRLDYQTRVDAAYRGLSPVTYGEIKTVSTGFRPVDENLPVGFDDSAHAPRVLLGVGADVSIDGNTSGSIQGPIIDIPAGGGYSAGYYTGAFTAVLRCVAGLYYSDGSVESVPPGTTYEWGLFFANATAPTISNGDMAVASAAIPSGLSLGRNAVYEFSCQVTTPSGLTVVGGVFHGSYSGAAMVRVQYFRAEAP